MILPASLGRHRIWRNSKRSGKELLPVFIFVWNYEHGEELSKQSEHSGWQATAALEMCLSMIQARQKYSFY